MLKMINTTIQYDEKKKETENNRKWMNHCLLSIEMGIPLSQKIEEKKINSPKKHKSWQ